MCRVNRNSDGKSILFYRPGGEQYDSSLATLFVIYEMLGNVLKIIGYSDVELLPDVSLTNPEYVGDVVWLDHLNENASVFWDVFCVLTFVRDWIYHISGLVLNNKTQKRGGNIV